MRQREELVYTYVKAMLYLQHNDLRMKIVKRLKEIGCVLLMLIFVLRESTSTFEKWAAAMLSTSVVGFIWYFVNAVFGG